MGKNVILWLKLWKNECSVCCLANENEKNWAIVLKIFQKKDFLLENDGKKGGKKILFGVFMNIFKINLITSIAILWYLKKFLIFAVDHVVNKQEKKWTEVY
jgi:hypothetical protein